MKFQKVSVIVGILLLCLVELPSGISAQTPACSTLVNSPLAAPEWYAKNCSDYYASPAPKEISKKSIGDIAYALNLLAGQFISFPLTDMSSATVIGPNNLSIFGLDFNTEATILYAIRNDIREFGTIDISTGAFTAIGTITGVGSGVTLTGLSVDPTDETFYMSTTNGSSSYLYTLNPLTGAAQLVVEISSLPLVIDIAINSKGEMFVTDIGADSLYAVNKATGGTTLIGSLGVDINYAQGMDFDFSDDTLYAWLYSSGNSFCSINTLTGQATPVSPGDSGEYEGAIKVSGTNPTSIPTLSEWGMIMLSLLIAGSAFMVIRRNQKV